MVARVRALLQRFCGVFAASLSPQIAAFLALASRGSLALGGSAGSAGRRMRNPKTRGRQGVPRMWYGFRVVPSDLDGCIC